MTPSDLPPLRDIIAQFGLRAEKKLGQNFLLDQNITDKIVRSAGDLSQHHVIEIGPGPGGLTRSLLQSSAKSVTAIEYDLRAIDALQHLKDAYGEGFHLIHGDALHIDEENLTQAPRMIIANLPYNISTVLLLKWLEQLANNRSFYTSLILMFQKEVAQRIVAPISNGHYGRLSVMAQWLCEVEEVFDLPPSAFTPPPKVTSTIVRFKPKPAHDIEPKFLEMEKIIAQAFNQRRKMLRSSLKSHVSFLEKCDIDPTLRAENLSVEQFRQLALAINRPA